MEGYYKIGNTFINGNKYDVYEDEVEGNEVDWLLVNDNKKLYKNCVDIILI